MAGMNAPALARTAISCVPFVGIVHTCEHSLKLGKESIDLESDGTYTVKEIIALENCFMNKEPYHGDWEEITFKAFEATLLLLRQIHESKGEVIKDYAFTKRELAKVE